MSKLNKEQMSLLFRHLKNSESNSNYLLLRKNNGEIWLYDENETVEHEQVWAKIICVEKLPPPNKKETRMWFSKIRIS